MGLFFDIHPVTPQQRILDKAVDILNDGGIIMYPTDTSYGFGCALDSAEGIQRIVNLKRLPDDHQFSIVCSNISDISSLAMVDDWTFAILKRNLPGPFTFILKARREVPKKILPKRKTIGFRIPQHSVVIDLVKQYKRPLLSSTAQLYQQDPIAEPEVMKSFLMKNFDLTLNVGFLPSNQSTVVDLTEGEIHILRQGIGEIIS